MARCSKFRIQNIEGLYYPCSDNKGADREADLRLCFRICKNPVFSRCGLFHLCDIKLDIIDALVLKTVKLPLVIGVV